jgi:hypothetical protein
MAYEDWNHEEKAASKHSLDASRSTAGDSSLFMDSGAKSYEVLSQSMNDSPTEGKVETMVYDGDGRFTSIVFRWQGSYDNTYYTVLGDVRKRINGATTAVGNFGFDSTTTLSNGSNARGQWFPYRVQMWIDAAGDLRFRAEEDADEDGTWTQLGNDVVDTSASFGGGGGIGVGSNAYDMFVDETEVYY